jgi:ribosomal silencing factor RsfS
MSDRTRKIFRIAIFAKDISILTGRSERACRAILNKIRKALGKSNQQFVTVREFCSFCGLEEDYVKEFL